MKKLFLFAALLLIAAPNILAQKEASKSDADAKFIRAAYDKTLTEASAYDWLTFLATKIGARLSGSPQAAAAVEYTRQMLDTLGLDRVWLQPCTVPHWVRGEKEQVRIVGSRRGDFDLNALALGGSVGTEEAGLSAEIVELKSLDDAEKMGKAGKLKGKIAFFNRPMDAKLISTFAAYSGAVDQRGQGASVASKYGAVASLVRSMTTRTDDIPHTGGTHYAEGVKPIPALAISTQAADLLTVVLHDEPVTRVFIRANCRIYADQPSFNVIGELRGSERPEEVIVVGGHLDSWDVGQGAHDDGAGVVHSMQVLQTMKHMGYKPKRTIRCVLFMNEENGLKGGEAYGKYAETSPEKHIAAIETDAGGFTPRGFDCEGADAIFVEKFKKLQEISADFANTYNLTIKKGGSGADIGPLRPRNTLLIGLRPDSQRYFDHHHTQIDTIDAVNKRELELGAAAITSLIYLIDKYGL